MMSRQQYSERMVRLASLVIVPAFFYSRAVVTICIGIFVLAALLSINRSDLRSFFSNRSFSLFTLLFFMIVISGCNSENVDQWLHHLNIKLPFLFIPLAFHKFGYINEEWIRKIHHWLIIVLSIVAIPVTVNYVLNYESIMAGMAVGHPIPTPIEHVKYSMMNAYGVMTGIVFLYRKGITLSMRNIGWLPPLVLFLFLFQHLIAVRTGLVILYCSLAIFLCVLVWRSKRFKLGALVGITAIIFVITAVNKVPSLQQKVGYMKYDLEQYRQGTGNYYSDSDRIQSWKVGWDIFTSAPLLGSGMGDLKDECQRIYRNELNRADFFRFPHNQFIYLLAGTGVLGLLFFVVGLYGPLITNRNYQYPLLLALYFNYSISFLVENSFERSFSIAFFLFFALLTIQGYRNSKQQFND